MPRITGGFSLTSRLGNALALSLQSRGLKTKNLLKQAWQIFLFNFRLVADQKQSITSLASLVSKCYQSPNISMFIFTMPKNETP